MLNVGYRYMWAFMLERCVTKSGRASSAVFEHLSIITCKTFQTIVWISLRDILDIKLRLRTLQLKGRVCLWHCSTTELYLYENIMAVYKYDVLVS